MWTVSLFQSARDNRPEQRLLNLDELRGLLTTWVEGESKSSLPAWSPTWYAPGTTRGKANVEQVTCLVFDLDDGMPVDAARELFSQQGWTFFLHTSWSHSPEVEKFRLVFPLWEMVPAVQWPRAWRAALAMWSEVVGDEWSPDTRCCDASRIFYLPAWRAEQSSRGRFAGRGGSFLELDWQSQPVEAPRPEVPDVPMPRMVTGGRIQAEIRRKLSEDPAARKALGRALGGAVGADLVRGVRCPKCNRRDVWFPVHPDKKRTAECNHRNSCGWFGGLAELALSLGVAA